MIAPRLFVFDVFGTLVDWRGSIAAAARKQWGDSFDGERFADAWRGEYQPAMERIRDGARGYVKLDVLHRENLDRVLDAFGLDATDEATRQQLTLEWHRLDAWPDVREGLQRLRSVGMVAPCSNGNIALMADLARHNGLHWDAIAGADLARDYKPKPRVYVEACEAFGLEPSQTMMVAAHPSDLEAASACGLRTAFLERRDEFGPGLDEREAPACAEQRVTNLVELAVAYGG